MISGDMGYLAGYKWVHVLFSLVKYQKFDAED
jgi:hypothetical protein